MSSASEGRPLYFLLKNQVRLGKDSDLKTFESAFDTFRPSLGERDTVYLGYELHS